MLIVACVVVIFGVSVTPADAAEGAAGNPGEKSQSHVQSPHMVSPFSGAFLYSFDFELPAGRIVEQTNAVDNPELGLQYNSQTKNKWSPFGHGWSLTGLGEIRRYSDTGVQDLYGSNTFSVSVAGFDGVLVALGDNVYGREDDSENGLIKYIFDPFENHWRFTDRQGYSYYLGETTQSRIEDDVRTFAWKLTRIEDPSGNALVVEYEVVGRAVYAKRMTYTLQGAHEPGVIVDFAYTVASPFVDMSAGFPLTYNQSIEKVTTSVNEQIRKETLFNFSPGSNGSRHLLQSIVQKGYAIDGSVSETQVEFEYRVDASTWRNVFSCDGRNCDVSHQYFFPEPMLFDNRYSLGVTMGDVNGDGLSDVLLSFKGYPSNSTTTRKVYINNAGKFELAQHCWNNDNLWNAPIDDLVCSHSDWKIPIDFASWYGDSGVMVLDVNGDGKVDIFRAKENEEKQLFINNGSGWDEVSSEQIPMHYVIDKYNRDVGYRFVDINNDGLVDALRYVAYQSGQYQHVKAVSLGTGSGWNSVWSCTKTFSGGEECEGDSRWDLPEPFITQWSSSQQDHGTRFVDINNDGFVDVIRSGRNNGAYTKSVHLGNGYGWNEYMRCERLFAGGRWQESCSGDTSWKFPEYFATEKESGAVRLLDVNADGLPDIVHAAYGDQINQTYLNTGHGWNAVYECGSRISIQCDTSSAYYFPINFIDRWGKPSSVVIVDITGDGKTDIVESKSGSGEYHYRNTLINNSENLNAGNDILVKVVSSTGAQIAIEYKMSTEYRDNEILENEIPFQIPTVSALILSDENTNDSYVITYRYANGRYYWDSPIDSEFIGFGRVDIAYPDGSRITNHYHLDPQLKGRSYAEVEFSHTGVKMSERYSEWEIRNLDNKRSFAALTAIATQTEDDASGTRFSYDQHLRKADVFDDGVIEAVVYDDVVAQGAYQYQGEASEPLHTHITYAGSGGQPTSYPSQVEIGVGSHVLSGTTYYYDDESFGFVSKGLLTGVDVLSEDEYVSIEEHVYDEFGKKIKTIHASGAETVFQWDSREQYIQKVTNAVGHTQRISIDMAIGLPLVDVSVNGMITETTYDGLGRMRMISNSSSDGSNEMVLRTEQFIDNSMRPRRRIRRSYIGQNNYFDTVDYLGARGHVLQSYVQDGAQWVQSGYRYDFRGNVIGESLAEFVEDSVYDVSIDYEIQTEYDNAGRILAVRDAIGQSAFSYDGWNKRVSDARGNTIAYTYDYQGNVLSVKDALGTTHNEYDRLGNLIRIIDGEGDIREFGYDQRGRRIWQTAPYSIPHTEVLFMYVYDDSGNVVAEHRPDGASVEYIYDVIGRVLEKNDGSEVVSFTYNDERGGVLAADQRGDVRQEYEYDAWGRVVDEILYIDDQVYEMSSEYDGDLLVSQTYPNNLSVHYEYDGLGRVVSGYYIDDNGHYEMLRDTEYHANGQFARQLYGGGLEIRNEFDDQRPTRLSSRYMHDSGNAQLIGLDYVYDENDNILSIRDTAEFYPERNWVYEYDARDQLVSAFQADQQFQYEYDRAGTRMFAEIYFEYDVLGRIIKDKRESRLFSWYYDNRLAVAGDSSFEYDAHGERVAKKNGDSWSHYLGSLITRSDGSSEIQLAEMGVLKKTSGGDWEHLVVFKDHLGGSSKVFRHDGTLVQDIEYTPYGELLAEHVSETDVSAKFTGHELDRETGLYYARARYYDPGVSQFLSPDPVAWNTPEKLLADPLTLNLYAYSKNNPLKYVDPTGKYPVVPAVVGLSAVIWDARNLPTYRDTVGWWKFKRPATEADRFKDAMSYFRYDWGGTFADTRRYLHTTEAGWVDLRHFYAAAEIANRRGMNYALRLGELKEWSQTFREKDSAYDLEDLNSNLLGAYFAAHYIDFSSGKDWETQLESYFRILGADRMSIDFRQIPTSYEDDPNDYPDTLVEYAYTISSSQLDDLFKK